MTSRRLLVALGLALVLVPRPASADWDVMPFVGFKFGAETNLVDLENASGDKKFIFGGSVSRMGAGIFGIEADFGYIPGFFQADVAVPQVSSSSVMTLMGNVVVAAPLRWTRHSLRPYTSGGMGLIRTRIDDVARAFRVDSRLLGVNVGGGAVGFLTDRTGVRWEVRYFQTVHGEDRPSGEAFGATRLNFWRGTMSVVFRY